MSDKKRKSKERLAAEALAQERKAKAKADAASSKGKKKTKKPTRCQLMPCNCLSSYQDRRYGQGKRLHNPRLKEGKHIGWTCTVCGKAIKF